MGKKQDEQPKKRSNARNLWGLVVAALAVVAIVQELRLPPEQRTWRGKVAGFVPYDFRKPTLERFRSTYWNEDGPIVSSRMWGVGWALNLGALKKRVTG
jgi:hypothetical protein